jgi:hypothetical protein
MRTWTGSNAPLREDIGTVNILDLVMHTGRETRWGGFGSTEYKVLHHLQLVSLIWLKGGFPREGLAYALAHDFHEAYTGDIPSPVKRVMGEGVKVLEKYLDGRIYESLGLPPPTEAMLRYVKLCDLAALIIEAPLFGPPSAPGGDGGNPDRIALTPEEAASPFYHPDVPLDLKHEVARLVEKAIPDLARVLKAHGKSVGDPL